MLRLLLSVFFVITLTTSLLAQPNINWQREYGQIDRLDEFWDVYLTAEGNFACCGSSQGRDNNIDGWLLIAGDEGEQSLDTSIYLVRI